MRPKVLVLAFIFAAHFLTFPSESAIGVRLRPGLRAFLITSFFQQYVVSANEDPIQEPRDGRRSYCEDVVGGLFSLEEKVTELLTLVRGATVLQDELEKLAERSHMAEDIKRAFEEIVEELKFLSPRDDVPGGHKMRQTVIELAPERAGKKVTAVWIKYGIETERARAYWQTIHLPIKDLVVLLGDVDQHPDLRRFQFEVLHDFVAAMLLPQYWFFSLFGHGFVGPVKTAKWLRFLGGLCGLVVRYRAGIGRRF
ncbi:hypothetical protein B0H16DRAFT_49017 [Mycena metata]|uniref:Uncharacterized protein n=1 Tax=Mycena metata TaxID=1033252 RepID=A0AAD7N0B2_9AGAR|nr:hypothetical protein B0H16DRAFT_287538 [Mycena metata]KAJ7741016.1 hypothetical protein B0H16DRAFT_49017 [Mycena metata]